MKILIFALLINVVHANQTLNYKPLHSCNPPYGYVDKSSVWGFVCMKGKIPYTKICNICRLEKPITEFDKNKTHNRYISKCKECRRNYLREYWSLRKDKLRDYYNKNKEKILIDRKNYRTKNREIVLAKLRENYHKKAEYYKKVRKEYVSSNRKKINDFINNKKNSNPIFKIRCNLHKRIWEAFKNGNWNKGGKSEILIGTTFIDAKNHLEKQFTEGMSWSNYGTWHIDHIIPLAIAKNEKELRALCHYTNLQPLWAKDNFSKGKKCSEEDKSALTARVIEAGKLLISHQKSI